MNKIVLVVFLALFSLVLFGQVTLPVMDVFDDIDPGWDPLVLTPDTITDYTFERDVDFTTEGRIPYFADPFVDGGPEEEWSWFWTDFDFGVVASHTDWRGIEILPRAGGDGYFLYSEYNGSGFGTHGVQAGALSDANYTLEGYVYMAYDAGGSVVPQFVGHYDPAGSYIRVQFQYRDDTHWAPHNNIRVQAMGAVSITEIFESYDDTTEEGIFDGEGWYHVKAEWNPGPEISVWVDGRYVGTADLTGTPATYGRFALASFSYGASTLGAAPHNPPQYVYWDDFKSYRHIPVPDGSNERALKMEVNTSSGTVSNVYSELGEEIWDHYGVTWRQMVYSEGSGTSEYGGVGIRTDGFRAAGGDGYYIEVRTDHAGALGSHASLASAKDGYIARFWFLQGTNPFSGFTEGVDGFNVNINPDPEGPQISHIGEWVDYKLEAVGDTINVYIHDLTTPIFSFVDPDPIEAGKVCVFQWDPWASIGTRVETYIDYLYIEALELEIQDWQLYTY